jgi:hypothetical protein
MKMNPEIRSACIQEYAVFDKILSIRDKVLNKLLNYEIKCLRERKQNYKLGFIEHESFSEEDNKY